jgi:DNA-binding XRE family transcriptional regulator
LPFCHLELKAERPKSALYPEDLITYGDHIRARRLDASMTQKQAAGEIGVDETSVFNWESNRVQPAVRLFPGIIRFLGYCLYIPAPPTSEWLKLIHQSMGFSQEIMAKKIGVDESTWRAWEAGRRKPSDKNRAFIVEFLNSPYGATS